MIVAPHALLSAQKRLAVGLAAFLVLWVWSLQILAQTGLPSFTEPKQLPFATHLAFTSLSLPLATGTITFLVTIFTNSRTTQPSLIGVVTALEGFLWNIPLIALGYKLVLDKQIGYIYYDPDTDMHVLLAEGFVYLLLADLWFYFAHRILHSERLFDFHREHHAHIAPTQAVAAFALDPLEWLIEGTSMFFFPLLVWPPGFNVIAWLGANAFIALMGVLVHAPGVSSLPLPWLNQPCDHQVHHCLGRKNCNFSLIFNVWDRAFGTYSPAQLR